MSTIQNLKNFIRHGKQARDTRSPPQDQATTHVSNVHAQQRNFHHQNGGNGDRAIQNMGISEPNVYDHKPLQANAQHQDHSAAAVDQRNVAAKAGHVAANAVDAQQKRENRQKEYDSSVLERIVAEERESKGRLPRYPGLERWRLVEKMGDGAFSNVYRAKDNNHVYEQVAIKVVRKFEMNSTQVSNIFLLFNVNTLSLSYASLYLAPMRPRPPASKSFESFCQHECMSGCQRPTSGLSEEEAQGCGGAQTIFTSNILPKTFSSQCRKIHSRILATCTDVI